MFVFVNLVLPILLSPTGWAQFNDTTDFSSRWNSTEQGFTISYIQDPTPDVLQVPESSDESWKPDVNPILRSIRNFFLQARDNFLESNTSLATSILEKDSRAVTEHVIDVLEKSLIEATTVLQHEFKSSLPQVLKTDASLNNQVLNVSVKDKSLPSSSNNSDALEQHSSINSTFLTSYSQCHGNLHSCVQKCFAQHNCYDVERDARECPPAPSRLCNPFAPWLPTDHCKDDEDCRSPLICCSDGCVQRCTSGVWKS